jgi:peptide/nickel transport system permease protein
MTAHTAQAQAKAHFGYRFNLVGIASSAVILAWALVAILAPNIIPHPVGEIIDVEYFGPISDTLWLGSDYLGRDMLSRILMGARYTIGISLAAVSISCFTGVVLGMTAAVSGGWLDAALSRFLDALSSIPSKLFGLLFWSSLRSARPFLS